ncbi:hypothetical protein ACOSQ3_003992 [Xanthoceras sorbifolium]
MASGFNLYFRWDIKGKIISCLHLTKLTSFCCFISSLICQGWKLLDAHKDRILALFFFVLEAVSVVLDQIEARTDTTIMAETQLKVVEVVFSVIQLIVTSFNIY